MSEQKSGMLLVDKPQGLTSHDVVASFRCSLGIRKVGHSGTLDPMATGLLVLGVGSATRLLHYLVGLDKEYWATICLGISTDTDDAEGKLTMERDASALTDAAIQSAIATLTGAIAQVPSTFSAVKVNGRRAYDRARAGEEVALNARQVTIHRFDLVKTRRAAKTVELDVQISCSSGTYIRALARDLGQALGVGGHLTVLRRNKVGPFRVSDAISLPKVGEKPPILLAAAAIATKIFPSVQLDTKLTQDISHGKRIKLIAPDAPVSASLTPYGTLAALIEINAGQARVLAGFPTEKAG